jgi:non-ribosomal peptide synthase protein (TIGR01720 family)
VLLIVVHHLVVDTVSWPVLLADLASAYDAAERGAPVRLPAKTTSFMRWSQRLTDLADAPDLAAEITHWRGVERAAGSLPRDHDGPNPVASMREVSVTLDPDRTGRLLREVPAAFRTQINDVLLSALGVALGEWCSSPSVVVDLEGHGREDVGPDIDVSRTVGWFTTLFPVRLSNTADPGALLRDTKEHLRSVPRKGLGYGLLRQQEGRPIGSGAPVAFNYLGQTSRSSSGSVGTAGARFRPVARMLGDALSGRAERTHLIEINAQILDDRLELTWMYGEQVHDAATVERWACRYLDVLTDLIEYCRRPDVGGNTPSDFPLAGLDQGALDLIQQRFTGGAR